MLEKEKINKLQNISKETEIHELLKELLPYMGYQNVTITHESGNVPEYGKDLIASLPDKIEEINEWTAFVVKKGDITGTSRMNVELQAQVKECFDYAYESLKYGKLNIAKVRIVTNGKINSGAKQKFFKDDFYSNANVIFWSYEELVKYIDKYYPRFWLKGSKNYKHYIELFQTRNKYDDFAKTLSLNDLKIERLLKNTIRLKLAEYFYDEDNGQFRRKWFEVEDLNKLKECSLIVGESGSGKTTLFKQIANNIIYENSIRNDFEFYPIILKFKDLQDNEFDVNKTIEQYFQQEAYQSLSFDVEALFEKKNFILFIDALDEIGDKENKEKALAAVKTYHETNSTIQIFCSSRNSDSLLGTCRQLNFRYFDIINISIQQAETFIDRYFDGEELKGKRLIKSLKDSRILDKLPKTPLTLTLLTSLFDEDGFEIPATISDLYKYFVDVLLNKNIKENHLDLLKVGVHRSVLSFIAEYLHTKRIKTISKSDLNELIVNFANERGQKYNVSELLNDLVQDINLLIENERGEIEFKHLSFQEYFTAYQFYNHSINGKSEFINNFNDVWWQNVAIFYAGMTKDSPQLIEDIISNSIPQDFHEYIVNVSGLGYLIQALYNTPVEYRKKAIVKNLESIHAALKFITNTQDEKYSDIKSFLHTTYGANKILAFWYEFHHSSVTLKELLNTLFNEMLEILAANQFMSIEEKNDYEYSAYLVAASLLNIEFDDFDNYFRLLNVTGSDNFVVQGLIESDFNNKFKTLTKEEKRRKSIKKFETRLSFLDNKKIDENVNVTLKDGARIKKPRQFKK
ncbi:NACHT domain-containing protein [Flavobacterium sp. J372]|uniref:NACHT domain-containing protein n=1 Tax=Flavobacterium sp. J372 TaxID=2898436 RepID=UPI002151C8A2|nr:NACHT domain-containing protein [Flavobacterium sp. J372]MCR5862702.1 NACHT domain-containing protein [Flavobacterium sp. J372]